MMRIAFYSQHVLGAGHYFRSLEIASSLAPHQVHMICGGTSVEADMPPNTKRHFLPELMMDSEFKTLLSEEPLEEVREERKKRLMDIMRDVRPDLFLVELFPFGRKKFGFELLPVLNALGSGELPPCPAVVSLRDILVEKKDQDKFETRVLKHLELFHGILVHADPKLATLEETFSRVRDIQVPISYTGYVTPKPRQGQGKAIRARLGLDAADKLILASAGGGNVGGDFLRAVLEGSIVMAKNTRHMLLMFTGPFLPDGEFEAVSNRAQEHGHIRVERFTNAFLEHLDAADLSVSMAGYNTSMNLLSSGTYGLVFPFAQNREQGMRAARLEKLNVLGVLAQEDLESSRLAERMRQGLAMGPPPGHGLNLDGGQGASQALASIVSRWREANHGQV